MQQIPYRQVRAVYNDRTIRVYQAYNKVIAESAVKAGTFRSPPFKMERMTWIKPSFLWMMYRCGWGMKDAGQARVLAIDVTREGFEWALNHACVSSFNPQLHESREHYAELKAASPVRVQWDPERDLKLQKLDYRSIQIGLTGKAVHLYVNQWIKAIHDITDDVHRIHGLIQKNKLDEARPALPVEVPYPLPETVLVKLDHGH